MTGIEWGSLMFGVMLLLLALRVHIGIAMLLTGSVGYVFVAGIDPLMSYFKTGAYARFSVYDLSVVPLFLLMGQFATHGGLSKALFGAAESLIRLEFSPLASAEAVLTPDELRAGVVLADIGAGTTDLAIYVEKAPWQAHSP